MEMEQDREGKAEEEWEVEDLDQVGIVFVLNVGQEFPTKEGLLVMQ